MQIRENNNNLYNNNRQQQQQIRNPNIGARRNYGGPRLLVNPKLLNHPKSGPVSPGSPASADSSINSSGGSLIVDPGLQQFSSSLLFKRNVSTGGSVAVNNSTPIRRVVRPPTTPQERPSFYNNSAGNNHNNTEIWWIDITIPGSPCTRSSVYYLSPLLLVHLHPARLLLHELLHAFTFYYLFFSSFRFPLFVFCLLLLVWERDEKRKGNKFYFDVIQLIQLLTDRWLL